MTTYLSYDEFDQICDSMKQDTKCVLGWTCGFMGWDWHEYDVRPAARELVDRLNALIAENVRVETMTDDERQLDWEEEARKVVEADALAQIGGANSHA